MVATTLLPNEVLLGDYHFNIRGPVRVQQATTQAGKLVIGKTSRADQTVANEWVQDDWRDGMLIDQMDEGTQNNNFYFSTADTRFRRRIVLPPLPTSISVPSGKTSSAELIFSFNSKVYASWSGTLYRWDDSSWSSQLYNAGAALIDYVVFNSKIYICWGTGYAYSSSGDAASWTAQAAEATSYFAAFQASSTTALFKIDSSGVVKSSADGATWVSSPGVTMTDVTPTGFVMFRNVDDEPTLYVSTATGLYSLDPYNQVYYKTSLDLLYNPNAGKSPKRWTDGNLYVPDTLALWKFPRGGTITNIGLDREDGLPISIRGHITKCEPHPNWFIVLVDSDSQGRPTRPFLGAEWGSYIFSNYESGGYSGIFGFNGTGWHCLYKYPSTGISIKNIHLSTVLNNYERRLYFSTPADVKYITLPEGNYDPTKDSNARFDTTGEFVSSWFDADYSEVEKLASSIKFRCENITSTETIAVYIRRNNNDNDEVLAGTISSTNIQTDGTVEFDLSDSLFDTSVIDTKQGMLFYSIRIRLVFSRGTNSYTTPSVLFYDLRHKPFLDVLWAYSFTIVDDPSYKILDVWKTLRGMAGNKKLYKFAFRAHEPYDARVIISNVGGMRPTATDDGGSFTVTIVEMEEGVSA